MEVQDRSLGPFLCRPSHISMGFWLALGPSGDTKDTYSVRIYQDMNLIGTFLLNLISKDNPFGVYLGEATGLLPNTLYSYELFKNNEVYLPLDLKPSDLYFYTLFEPHDSNENEFFLVSCHGVESYEKEFGKDNIDTWKMWSLLDSKLKDYSKCRLGILGGDQVYMDDTFQEDISKFDVSNPELMNLKIYNTYYSYWSNPSYRRIMARIPCLLMWDDHDLIDGWGSREEAHNKKLKPKWNEYGKFLSKAFRDMQSCRNNSSSNEKFFSFAKTLGKSAFLSLDLRSERNFDPKTGKAEMISSQHKKFLEDEIKKAVSKGIKRLFIISPVTVARMSGPTEHILASISNVLWKIMSFMGYVAYNKRSLAWFVSFIISYIVLY
ncbi:MAG: alkaline phosphatase D family protein, partial [Bacteriovoracia bacterium]